ncbi:MAG: hypothetical protein WCJ19_05830 [bacterium]
MAIRKSFVNAGFTLVVICWDIEAPHHSHVFALSYIGFLQLGQFI